MTRHPVYRALHVPKTVFGLDIEFDPNNGPGNLDFTRGSFGFVVRW